MNTVSKDLSVMRAILNQAGDEGLIEAGKNPLLSYKLKSEPSHKERLSYEDIRKLEGVKLKPASLIWHIRNAFLFSFYCGGIRFSDLCILRWENVPNGRRNTAWERRGRSTKPDLKIGICGDHGGNPSSVHFCYRIGMEYVSCSPYRVPVARLAAAQAALKYSGQDVAVTE